MTDHTVSPRDDAPPVDGITIDDISEGDTVRFEHIDVAALVDQRRPRDYDTTEAVGTINDINESGALVDHTVSIETPGSDGIYYVVPDDITEVNP